MAVALKTQEIVLNMGPQHPSTHGVFRMVLTLEGETIVDLKPVYGYLHRGIEKLSEGRSYLQAVPITDRLDYMCALTNEFAYAVAVEKLADIKPPERAEYIRVILAEFTRILNHMMAIGFLFNDLGAYFTPVLYAFRAREHILDLIEWVSGSRMMPNYIRPGGVAGDLPEGFIPQAKKLVDHLWKFADELDTFLSENEIFLQRARGVGVLPPDVAIAYGVTGPVLRASGVKYDVRRAEPYSIYERFDFEIPTLPNGDVYDRYMLRLLEWKQSLRILEQALDQIPDGPVSEKVPRRLRPPKGEVYGRIEAPKGELGFYLVSDGSDKPYRFKIRPTSFVNLGVLREITVGHKVADVVIILGSIDITMGEVDR